MADKNWGIKIYCECGAKYYSMNKKDKIICPICSAQYIQDDINLRIPSVAPLRSNLKKNEDDITDLDDVSVDEDSDDIISLEDQKEIEDNNEDFKTD